MKVQKKIHFIMAWLGLYVLKKTNNLLINFLTKIVQEENIDFFSVAHFTVLNQYIGYRKVMKKSLLFYEET